jgi:hypothetical protein
MRSAASTLLAINLAHDWTNSSVTIQSIPKPAGCPNLRNGGIWTDSKNEVLYTGFAGVNSFFGNGANYSQGLWSFTPDNSGSNGTWQNLNATADTTFTTQPRAFKGEVTSGNGAGFFLGGNSGFPTTRGVQCLMVHRLHRERHHAADSYFRSRHL